jgi:hypothetical protein
MKRILFLSGLTVWLLSCSNNSDSAGTAGEIKDTNKTIMTNSGGASTGGVGAGYGTGGAGISDTVTKTGAVNDNTKAEKKQQKQ